ncbi:MAG: class I SAM-dependent methyltransferase [Bacteroidota bacterium]
MKNALRSLGWLSGVLLVAALASGCAGTPYGTTAAPPDFHALVASPDRSAADREEDVRRKPEQLLEFTGVRPGMKVLEIGAGNGYTAELLARAVGSRGRAYAQNTAPREAFDVRMQTPAMKNVVALIRPFDDPAPSEVKDLDLITVILIYHDTTYLPVDRARMDRRFFELLKPGGHLIVVDHSAKAGAGTSVGKTLHRIEEAVVRREVEAAGFRLESESDFLRNPADPREESFFRMKMPTDRFALKFVKP